MTQTGGKLPKLFQLFHCECVVLGYKGGILLLEAVSVKEVSSSGFFVLVFVVVFVDESGYVCFNIERVYLLIVKLITVLDTGPILRYRVLLVRPKD